MDHVAESAVLEEGVELGPGSVVWDHTQIRAGARLGCECIVGRNVYIDSQVVVGDRCKIQNNALLYGPATLDDGVFIGPGAILTNDPQPRAVTPSGMLKAADDWVMSGVCIGEGASVGAGAVIVGGNSIGAWSLVGAGAVVTRDVPDYGLVVGNPARRIAWVGRAGTRLEAIASTRWRCPESAEVFVERDGKLEPEGLN
jgi:UDP-2-acetamido-3-amino-2,3-dideoxy-glucuronate N-acetyltransferase